MELPVCACKKFTDADLLAFARLMEGAGFRLYAVGGMLRNALMGLPASDVDVASAMRPDALMALLDEHGIHYVKKGLRFGMLEVHMGGAHIEHTTFRRESYGEGGAHRPERVSFSDSLKDDAVRRDFTVNALYMDVLTGKMKDPTGGVEDIQNKTLRMTGADTFRDDGLRIMRLARFCAELGFSPDPATFAAAKENAGLLMDISPERIRDELDRVLLSDSRYGNTNGPYEGLCLLSDLGVFPYILPELEACRGVLQRPEHHMYDVLDHIMHTVPFTPPVLRLRLAALLHDIGKPVAVMRTGKMYVHDELGESMSREILSRLRYPNAMVESVSKLIGVHMYDLKNTARDDTLKAHFAEIGREFAQDLIILREADVLGSGRAERPVGVVERWRDVLKNMEQDGAPFSEAELLCTGEDIMRWLNIPASKDVGVIKRRLLRHCAVHPEDNRPERLEKLSKGMML